MPQEAVLACMGPPSNRAAIGGTEVWSYDPMDSQTIGFGTANAFFSAYHASAFGVGLARTYSCKINVVFDDGQVRRVNYLGATGRLLAPDEQCATAVHNCLG